MVAKPKGPRPRAVELQKAKPQALQVESNDSRPEPTRSQPSSNYITFYVDDNGRIDYLTSPSLKEQALAIFPHVIQALRPLRQLNESTKEQQRFGRKSYVFRIRSFG